jgi:hypothetical protein
MQIRSNAIYIRAENHGWLPVKSRKPLIISVTKIRNVLSYFSVDVAGQTVRPLHIAIVTALSLFLLPWVPPRLLRFLSSTVKRPARETSHLSPTSAEVKNTWIYISIPPYAFMA